MNKIYILFKTTLINSLGINKIIKEKSEKEKIKNISIFLSIAIAILSLVFSTTISTYHAANELEKMGFLNLQIIMGFILSSLIIFFTSIYKAQGLLFSSKDYDLLMSLPIKRSAILINKMLNLLGLNYFILLFAFLPQAIVYFLKADIQYLYFVYLFFVFIFLPLIPIVLSAFFAFIISYISSKMRYKNLIINIGTILISLIVVVALYNSGNLIQDIIINSKSLAEGISNIYPPSIYATRALVSLSLKDLLVFISISLLVFAIFIFIFSKSFKIINSKLQESFSKSNYKLGDINTSSQIVSLIKKEIKRYFSTPIYVLNTIIGPIMIIAAAVATLLFGKDMLFKISEINFSEELIPLFTISLVCGILSISCTTNSSISLEGKNLWILKSSPIKAIDIFKSKIALNLILILPATIVSDIIFFTALKLSLINVLALLLITSIYSFIVSILGLIINLYFPKLNWTTETSVVKQGASVMIQMLLSAAIVAIPTIIFILTDIKNYNLFIITIIIYLSVILIVLWKSLNIVGVKLFNKL